MTETRKVIERDERGLIEAVVEPNRTVKIERDKQGRAVALVETTAPTDPVATAADLERVERTLTTTRRTTAEAVELLDHRTERLRQEIDDATAAPEPASWQEYADRVRRLVARLGSKRDGGPLHMAVVGAVAAADAGDVIRACELLRGAEGEA